MFNYFLYSVQLLKQLPALFYGLLMLLTIYGTLYSTWVLLIPIGIMIIPLLFTRAWGRLACVFAFVLFVLLWMHMSYQFPALPKKGARGTVEFEISSVSLASTHFGKRWIYRGTVGQFIPDDPANEAGRSLPCTISLQAQEGIRRPLGNCSYRIAGRLKEVAPNRYVFTVGKHTPWYPILGSWSLAEYRYWAKQEVSHWIKNSIAHPQAATFLAGIATGDFDDRQMVFEFGRFGLQHIMAISGFHFAIVAAILSVLLRLVVPLRLSTKVLLLLLSSYFLFLGCSPSVMRAWVMALAVLVGFVLQRRGSGLNSLGVALIVVLLCDPLQSQNIGFQFSFAVTAAILMLYQPMEKLCQKVYVQRSLSEVVQMDLWNQHAYCVVAFFRQGLALTFAVNLVAFPMTLFLFHKFPLMSVLYNLFFPFLVSFSMLFLMLSLLFYWTCPLLEKGISWWNSIYTQWVLNFTYEMPTTFDYVFRVQYFPIELLVVVLTAVFIFGTVIKEATQDVNA